MARAGLGVIVDEVLLGGGAAQQRLAELLDGSAVLWSVSAANPRPPRPARAPEATGSSAWRFACSYAVSSARNTPSLQEL